MILLDTHVLVWVAEGLPRIGRRAIGIVAGEIGGLRGDPADRMIVATAMALDATLVTADESLLDWEGTVRMVDARN